MLGRKLADKPTHLPTQQTHILTLVTVRVTKKKTLIRTEVHTYVRTYVLIVNDCLCVFNFKNNNGDTGMAVLKRVCVFLYLGE